MRQEEAKRMELRERDRQREHAIAHARTLEGRALDAKLDKAEAAQDSLEQGEARAAREWRQQQYAATQKKVMEEKKQLGQTAVLSRQASKQKKDELAYNKKAKAKATREYEQANADARRQNEAALKEELQQRRAAMAEAKREALQKREASLEARRTAAKAERDNDVLFRNVRADDMATKKEIRQN
eukprot:3182804-Prymnesium_polylepis.1